MHVFDPRVLRSALVALVGTITLLTGTPSRAALVSFDYTGQSYGGATVQGTFGWETTVAATPTTIGQGGVVLSQHFDGAGFLTGQVSGGVLDGQTIAASGLTWNIMDMDSGCAGCSPDSLYIMYSPMFVMLSDDTRTALSGLDLPTALDLSNWGSEHRVRLANLDQGVGAMEDFTLLSLKLSAATTPPRDSIDLPEPGSLALLPLAAVCALLARRRTQR